MCELAANTIDKNPIIFKVLLENIYELCLRHLVLGFKDTFMLISLLHHNPVEK